MTIILGNYIDSNIKVKRGLPSFNPAASNRMLRLAQSLQAVGEETIIVSPACAMNLKWTGILFYKQQIETIQNIKIHYCSAIGLPVLGMLFEQINVIFTIWKLSRKYRVKGLIVYCYYPSSVLASLFAKYILGITIIEDLEDICVPKISDWKRNVEANPIQQIVGWFLMKIMLLISNGVVIPTSKFLYFLKRKDNVVLITGCIEVPIFDVMQLKTLEMKSIRVLFSGALEDENGVSLLIDFFKLLDRDEELSRKFIFDISGHGSKSSFLQNEITIFKNLKINFHGFLAEDEYTNLLANVKIALVLQNPSGRYSNFKTPSKGYEYISNAKTVIVSDIGDFAQLPRDVLIMLESYDSKSLFEIFKNLTLNQINSISENAYSYSKQNWNSSIVGYKLLEILKKNNFN